MIEDTILISIKEFGTAITFIIYLIWQRKQDREDNNQERTSRIEEKNQFIKILDEIKQEIHNKNLILHDIHIKLEELRK